MSSLTINLQTVSMMGYAKGNAQGQAFAQAAAEEAKAKYGNTIKIVELEPIASATLVHVYQPGDGWAPLESDTSSPDIDDGTYSQTFGAEDQKTDEAADLIAEFKLWADMTPAERIRAQYLEDHDLTEEDLKAMGDDDRNAILEEIREAVARQLSIPATEGVETEIMKLLQG